MEHKNQTQHLAQPLLSGVVHECEQVDVEANAGEQVDVEANAVGMEGATTWKQRSGRTDGKDRYVFGDVTKSWIRMNEAQRSIVVPPSRAADLLLHKIAAREAHLMIIGFLCGKEPVDELGVPVAYSRCIFRRNPIYWGCWAGCAALIYLGSLLHYPVNQHRRTREDECAYEGEVRIQWIYCCDGCYFLFFLWDCTKLVYFAKRDGMSWESSKNTCGADCYLIAIMIYLTLMTMDFLFISAMKHKSMNKLRVVLITLLLFGVVVLAFLLISAISGNLDNANTQTLVEWLLRILVVGFYLFMGVFYCQLWNVYSDSSAVFDADGDGVEDDCCAHLRHCTIFKTAGPAIVALGLLSVAYALQPDAVWNALG